MSAPIVGLYSDREIIRYVLMIKLQLPDFIKGEMLDNSLHLCLCMIADAFHVPIAERGTTVDVLSHRFAAKMKYQCAIASKHIILVSETSKYSACSKPCISFWYAK